MWLEHGHNAVKKAFSKTGVADADRSIPGRAVKQCDERRLPVPAWDRYALTFFVPVHYVNVAITMMAMRRALVLTHEQARHPFRRSLPRHIFAMPREQAAPPPAPHADDEDQDWKLFMLSFAAFFTVAYTFIL